MKDLINSNQGINRTGMMSSLVDSLETKEGAETLTSPSAGFSSELGENRIRYMREAEPIGSMPKPGKTKGLFSNAKSKMSPSKTLLMDKLGERLAFERSGVRLYEALLSKYHGSPNKEILPPLEQLEHFYEAELNHFTLVSDVILELGGDPTAVTPSADVTGVASCGWVQVIADPRTTFMQSLEVIHMAELVDNACWELLIELARNNNLEQIASSFEEALEEEREHLENVTNWLRGMSQSDEAISEMLLT
ncbi:ferritin-like domain-containing protein [Peredibacter starrii]|uniref:Ferritin-like domain-containing protein n=1 Tax=Peredibacter starrii TaxID=28202 RepID=A0AAX4HL42_9BACT|nr:ferritin-like domain-containing protein [Peredibacter starrii]WPU63875.1 ferritin-like domain-containing protein [Peredibacter starrii]